jgi:ribonuclease P/MRP protein subunit POP5
VARDHHRIAWGAVTFLSSVEGQKFIPNVVHVSGKYCKALCLSRTSHDIWTTLGTIKHAQLAAIKHNREVIALYRSRAKIAGDDPFHTPNI